MEEILPLFAKTSETLSFDGWSEKLKLNPKSSWESGYMRSGEQDEIPSRLHFPMSWRQLVSGTELNRLARTLRPAGRGVEFWWGSAASRPAPASLRLRHADFSANEEGILQGIAGAPDDDSAGKFKRSRSALVENDDA